MVKNNIKGKGKDKGKKKKKEIKISKIKSRNINSQKLSTRTKLKAKKKTERKKRGLVAKEERLNYNREDARKKQEEEEENGGKVEEEEVEASDVEGMIDTEDMEFLTEHAGNKAYSLLRGITIKKDEPTDADAESKVNREEADDADEEEEMKGGAPGVRSFGVKTTQLLPIKTKHGVLERTEEVNSDDQEMEDDDSGDEADGEDEAVEYKEEVTEVVSVVDLMADRQRKLTDKRIKIGSLAFSLLENPEDRIVNLRSIMQVLDISDPDIAITVRKIAIVTLLEVFNDLLPDYKFKHTNQDGQTLKKETKKLYTFENNLILHYTNYLKKLESYVEAMKKGGKTGNARPLYSLGVLSIRCMSDLLVKHTYFNFGENMIRCVVPFMNHKDEQVATIVCSAIKKLFKSDQLQQMALVAVRCINKLVKKHEGAVRPMVIETFLSLRLHANLDAERDHELTKNKKINFQEKRLRSSKRDRKSNKFRQKVMRELEATRAEVNKEQKSIHQTEITKTVFMIYFRVLKSIEERSKLIGVTLEGLAKFAHLINVDFFGDLVTVLHDLVEEGHLSYREQLHCVQCVFTILAGQGQALNIDPQRFYTHAYKSLFYLHAGSSHGDTVIALDALHNMLIKRRKRVSVQRVMAFSKRLSTLALHLDHSGMCGVLALLKNINMYHKQALILLDPDAGVGSGVYLAEIDNPEYCNANATALYELPLLKKCYNSSVRTLAEHILSQGDTKSGETELPSSLSLKSGVEVLRAYEFGEMRFNPPVPPPRHTELPVYKQLSKLSYHDAQLDALVQQHHKDVHTPHNIDWYSNVRRELGPETVSGPRKLSKKRKRN